ncbi:MAG: ribosomal L7Ae/L30e/S12e/Gadd45 family protein [Christensenella sp.]|nr:ribosomal L7Ae/L30e/S12e/Gadd45 family protein [Christensenella sp.]
MYEELKNAANKVVGLKQLLRNMEAQRVITIYVADDAEDHVKERIMEAIGKKEIRVISVETMKELGQVCGIEVGAACAAVIEN